MCELLVSTIAVKLSPTYKVVSKEYGCSDASLGYKIGSRSHHGHRLLLWLWRWYMFHFHVSTAKRTRSNSAPSCSVEPCLADVESFVFSRSPGALSVIPSICCRGEYGTIQMRLSYRQHCVLGYLPASC